ncbi:Pirin domain-containing protein [Reticulomyxa filosa]|uniref:Pirin domain-containing protein n=1 Tax=Reticulomyxa filosa TaxID=46433 RepID=X6MNS5_RETFI|nr:Pirin domain-containing protein [Reticulomyxa filosa]|eukprot:ETO14735.1 Pirin domain-containing protein [Reticulomyxa filosa]
MGFGCLRVLNDDIVKPENGFETHFHRHFEIFTAHCFTYTNNKISYVIEGDLTHKDSITEKDETLCRGDFQFMSAGKEEGKKKIKIKVKKKTNKKSNKKRADRLNRLLHVISPLPIEKPLLQANRDKDKDEKLDQSNTETSANAPIQLRNDCNVLKKEMEGRQRSRQEKTTTSKNIFTIWGGTNSYVSELEENHTVEYKLKEDRQLYLVCIEGIVDVTSLDPENQSVQLYSREAVKIYGGSSDVPITIKATGMMNDNRKYINHNIRETDKEKGTDNEKEIEKEQAKSLSKSQNYSSQPKKAVTSSSNNWSFSQLERGGDNYPSGHVMLIDVKKEHTIASWLNAISIFCVFVITVDLISSSSFQKSIPEKQDYHEKKIKPTRFYKKSKKHLKNPKKRKEKQNIKTKISQKLFSCQ